MGQIDDKKLFDLIEGKITGSEAEELKDQINNDKDLKRRFELLGELDTELREFSTLKPPSGFPDKVMRNLYNVKYKTATSNNLFGKKNILTFIGILAGIAVGIYILSTGLMNTEFFQGLNIPSFEISDQQVNLQPLNNLLDGNFLFKAFLFFDLILAILLLDRLVFKPLFKGKKRAMSF